MLLHTQSLYFHRAMLLQHPLSVPGHLMPPGNAPLLPVDWPLLPIVVEYNKTIQRYN